MGRPRAQICEGETDPATTKQTKEEEKDEFVTFGTFRVLEDGNVTFGKFTDSEVKKQHHVVKIPRFSASVIYFVQMVAIL